MGTAQRSSVLRRAEACSIVPRDNSCLYLWQANRLIKGRPCLFLCPIPSPEQTLPYLHCAALAASTFPSLLCSEALARRESRHSVTERRRCSKNACLIVKLSQSPSWWNAASAALGCYEYRACVTHIMCVIIPAVCHILWHVARKPPLFAVPRTQ